MAKTIIAISDSLYLQLLSPSTEPSSSRNTSFQPLILLQLFAFTSGSLNFFFLLPLPRILFKQIFNGLLLSPLSLLKTITYAKTYKTTLPWKTNSNKILYSTLCQTHRIDPCLSCMCCKASVVISIFVFSLRFTRMQVYFLPCSTFLPQTQKFVWEVVHEE